MRLLLVSSVVAAIALTGCSKELPTQPTSSLRTSQVSATSAASASGATTPLVAAASARPDPGPPGYEPAYEDGNTVIINAIEIPGKVAPVAQADLYEVVYPPDWQALGIAAPQCAPCDHDGNGIDMLDFHDHVLDTAPGDVGYRVPWRVLAVVPAYNGDAAHNAAVGAVYKAHLPLKSESAIDEFLAMKLPSGAPVAVQVDPHVFFLCAVVDPHAAR
jgi:hypothetical protein